MPQVQHKPHMYMKQRMARKPLDPEKLDQTCSHTPIPKPPAAAAAPATQTM